MDPREVEESSKDKSEFVDDDSVPKANKLRESHPTEEVDMNGEKCLLEEDAEEDDSDEEEDVEEDDEEEEEEEGGEEDETEEPEDDEEDEHEQTVKPRCSDASEKGTRDIHAKVSFAKNLVENVDSRIDGAETGDYVNNRNTVCNVDSVVSGEVCGRAACVNTDDFPIAEVSLKSEMETDQPPENDENGLPGLEAEHEEGENMNSYDSPSSQDVNCKIVSRSHTEGVAPTAQSSVLKVEYVKEEELKIEPKTVEETMDDENRNQGSVCIFDTDTSGGGESGTNDEQAAFMHELEKFHKERSLEFKPPKFYGELLNLLKLWRAVMKLGGYEKVTACKYWRQVGESFNPPKTCTTISWTFRIFYEKALVEYERYRTSGDGPSAPTSLPVLVSVENQSVGSGRARRDSAARAMQGWHSQRVLDNGEVSDPIIKDKNSNSLSKKEKQLKNLGLLKRKKPSTNDAVKVAGTNIPKTQSETTVIDIGSPADWVKINVRETKDCYEVYALVPGLLREEVRVQSDPAGRLVISGEPENPDNPWNVTPFKKVVSLPSRIDPHQTSAVVTLHGQLFVRVPFEHYD